MPPRCVTPLEALGLLTSKLNPRTPLEFPTGEAPHGYLAEAVECSPCALPAGSGGIAATDGYALPRGTFQAGDTCRIAGALSIAGPLAIDQLLAPREPGSEGSEPEVWRLESGAPVPAGCDRVLPVADAVVTGRGRIRILRLPCEGEGIHFHAGRRGDGGLARWRFEAGTHLSSRLQAFLLAHGVSSVHMLAPFTVALATVGDELTDAALDAEPGQVRDLTAGWLSAAVSRLGLVPLPLGILPDSPAALRDAILHVRERASVLLLAGGLGDGLTDRTVEGLDRFDATALFERLALDGCSHLLFAKTQGIDVIGLGGSPLEAAAGYDLFVLPALLARLGASARAWDWSQAEVTVEAATLPQDLLPLLSRAGAPWVVRPAAELASGSEGGEGVRLRILDAGSGLSPTAPGQDGWAVLPASLTTGGRRRAYFQAALEA